MISRFRAAASKAHIELINAVLNQYFRRRYPFVSFGKKIRYYGAPMLCFAPGARVTIGNKCVFTSKTLHNWAGINKPCSLFVAPKAKLVIGENTGLSGVSLYCSVHIEIGANVCFGANSVLWDTDFHQIDPISRANNIRSDVKAAGICVADNVFIGAFALILKGVRIGENAVIGAGSVVTRDVPANQIWAGNPARYIKHINC